MTKPFWPPKSCLLDECERSVLSSSTIHSLGRLEEVNFGSCRSTQWRNLGVTYSRCDRSSLLWTMATVYEENDSAAAKSVKRRSCCMCWSLLCCNSTYTALYNDIKQKGGNARAVQRGSGEAVHSCFSRVPNKWPGVVWARPKKTKQWRTQRFNPIFILLIGQIPN